MQLANHCLRIRPNPTYTHIMADAEILLHEDEHQPSDATASEVIGKRDGDQLERNCELLDKAHPQSVS